MPKMSTCLWFDDNAEEAVKFYMSVFKDGKIGRTERYTEVGREHHEHEPGTVMSIEFQINGHEFVALNGGPIFKFTEAVSFQIHCHDQKEIDYYYDRLREGGGQEQPCGWLKDRFGLSWQVNVIPYMEMMASSNQKKSMAATKALFTMTRPILADLKKAFDQA